MRQLLLLEFRMLSSSLIAYSTTDAVDKATGTTNANAK